MSRTLLAGVAMCALAITGCGGNADSLANDFYNAIDSGNAAQFKSVAEQVQKLSADDQKKFGEAFKQVMESKIGNDQAKGMAFIGKMFAVAKDMPGMPGMPGGGNPFGGGMGFGGGGGGFGGFGGGPANPGGAPKTPPNQGDFFGGNK
jgi:hypothetical protein